MPIKSEINAFEIARQIKQAHPYVKTALPLVTDMSRSEMIFREFKKDGDLKIGQLSILVPKDNMEVLQPDILIVPLCAYDC